MSSYSLYEYGTTNNPNTQPPPNYQTKPTKSPRTSRISPIVFCILQFIILILTILGVCLDQIRPNPFVQKYLIGCISFWSVKRKGENCITGKGYFASTSTVMSACKTRGGKVSVGGGMGIAAILLVFIGFVIGCGVMWTGVWSLRFLCVGANVFAFIFLCVAWAMVVDIYLNSDEPNPAPTMSSIAAVVGQVMEVDTSDICLSMKAIMEREKTDEVPPEYQVKIGYGSGFGLLVASWCLVLVNTIICLLPC
ncbi:Amastin surface glycoprotein, putative [Angomonas deanei]|uniref:Amastin surface glycoprotein, putative n=1 Tax=Angomonas deanei TaxID=59799 RepID=A0A7G2C042_9TRYP|nr:Amastin surface glycoprotein, putative [Angomonas deanei]